MVKVTTDTGLAEGDGRVVKAVVGPVFGDLYTCESVVRFYWFGRNFISVFVIFSVFVSVLLVHAVLRCDYVML